MGDVTGYKQQSRSSQEQVENRERLVRLFKERPLPDDQLLINLGMYVRSSALAKILWINELYQMILPIPGSVLEFGVWWGQTLVLCENMRAVYEPYNHSRRIIGFDTFAGYPEPSAKDRPSETIKSGGYTVTEQYQTYLDDLLEYHRHENILGHIKKHELVVGDVTETIDGYLSEHPEALIALAIFDLALFEPTKKCLQAITPRLIPGSIVAFDELNCAEYPGETEALREVWGLGKFELRRSKFLPDRAYAIIR